MVAPLGFRPHSFDLANLTSFHKSSLYFFSSQHFVALSFTIIIASITEEKEEND
jgi:hypothetical protein